MKTSADKQILLAMLPAAAALLALAACGTKTNAVGDYADVRAGAVAPYAATSRLGAPSLSYFTVSITDANKQPVTALQFHAGRNVQYYVRAGFAIQNAVTNVQATGLPAGVKMDGDSSGGFVISGTPLASSCQALAQASVVTFSGALANPDKVGKDYVAYLQANPQPAISVPAILDGKGAAPTIVSVAGLEGGADEGHSKQFTVDVLDVNANKDHPPTLIADNEPGMGQEVHKVNAGSMVENKIGDAQLKDPAAGIWTFTRTLNPEKVAWLNANEKEVAGRMILRAIDSCNPDGVAKKLIDVQIRRAQAAPTAAQAPSAVAPTPAAAADDAPITIVPPIPPAKVPPVPKAPASAK